MQIDALTLADLEVEKTGRYASPLFVLLDHTRTAGGAKELREILLSPLSTAAEIRARQMLLKGLNAEVWGMQLRELDSLIQRVSSYLESSFLLLPEGAIERWVCRRRYPEIVSVLIEGLDTTGELLRFARGFVASLNLPGVELGEAREIVEVVEECLDDPVCSRLAAQAERGIRYRLAIGKYDSPLRGNPHLVDLLKRLIKGLHRFDALQSLAAASAHRGFTFPDIRDKGEPFLQVDGLFHPLIKQPVRNDFRAADQTRVLFLTGPNMAGKSTFMKACGLVVLFAHLGMAVPASSASLRVCDRLFAALTVRDSITAGESFFLAEVRRVRSLVDYVLAGEVVFALLDEMFKGTNVLDARDATTAVVVGLSHAQSSFTIVASHIVEVANAVAGDQAIELACFDVQMKGTAVEFSYRLNPGVSDQRVGWMLLEREGVVERLKRLSVAHKDPNSSKAQMGVKNSDV